MDPRQNSNNDIKQVAIACIIAFLFFLPILIPFWLIVFFLFFAFGPSVPDMRQYLNFVLVTLPYSAFIFSLILRKRVIHSGRSFSYLQAFTVATVSLSLLQASLIIATISDTSQSGYIGLEVFLLVGLILSICSAIFLTQRISTNINSTPINISEESRHLGTEPPAHD